MTKTELLEELSAALVDRHRCAEMVMVDEERLRLTRDRFTYAGRRVDMALEAIRKSCDSPREPQTMGELYKKHGLR